MAAGVPKALVEVAGRPLLIWTLTAVRRAHPSALVVVVAPPRAVAEVEAVVSRVERVHVVPGGPSRRASVRAGFEALRSLGPRSFVWVHDASRPLLTVALVARLRAAMQDRAAAFPVLAVADALGRQMADKWEPLDRRALLRVQTPQVFRWEVLDRVLSEDAEPRGDEAAAAWGLGYHVGTVPGDPLNLKVTWPGDLEAVETVLQGRFGEIRVGLGWDAHAFQQGRPLWLGGVEIPHSVGLAAHSDGDVLCHAVADALLGACGLGDIGEHFPPGEDRWHGLSGTRLLQLVVGLIEDQGWEPVSVDAVVVCEEPRLAPYRSAMVAALSLALGLPEGAVSVKASTAEGMGFVGRREGIAAQAVAVVRRRLTRGGGRDG